MKQKVCYTWQKIWVIYHRLSAEIFENFVQILILRLMH